MISSTFAWASREVFWKVMEIEVLEVTVMIDDDCCELCEMGDEREG